MSQFGTYVREKREALKETDPSFSLRKFAAKVAMPASWVSRIERGDSPPPDENRIQDIAEALGEDPDLLMALSGKISETLRDRIGLHPKLFAEVVKFLREAPEDAILRVVREVRDGSW